MPILKNPRHERFAQELAKGKSASEAYELAGFKANDGNCIRLKGNERVASRVAELQQRAAARVEVDKQWVLEQLIDNATKAKAKEDYSPANRALELVGKELGMFIDRSERGAPGEFDELDVEQKRNRILAKVRQLGVDHIGPTRGTA
jgi:phage terminase small subunit